MSLEYGNLTLELVINTHQILEQNIPTDYLPFALDWSDNILCLNLKIGNEYGKVIGFYFDTDEEPEIIASSLEDILGVNSIDEM